MELVNAITSFKQEVAACLNIEPGSEKVERLLGICLSLFFMDKQWWHDGAQPLQEPSTTPVTATVDLDQYIFSISRAALYEGKISGLKISFVEQMQWFVGPNCLSEDALQKTIISNGNLDIQKLIQPLVTSFKSLDVRSENLLYCY